MPGYDYFLAKAQGEEATAPANEQPKEDATPDATPEQ